MAYFAAVTAAPSAPGPSMIGDKPAWVAPLERPTGEETGPTDPIGARYDHPAPKLPDSPPMAEQVVFNRSARDDVSEARAPTAPLVASAWQQPNRPSRSGATDMSISPTRPVAIDDAARRRSPRPIDAQQGETDQEPADRQAQERPVASTATRAHDATSTARITPSATPGRSPSESVERHDDVRLAPASVPRRVRRREADVRTWLNSNPEVVGVPAESHTTVHIDRVIVESLRPLADAAAPSRERPEAKGFSDYDSIRRR